MLQLGDSCTHSLTLGEERLAMRLQTVHRTATAWACLLPLIALVFVLSLDLYASPSISPISRIIATPLGGVAPLSVSFDATGSYDPGGQVVQYYWQFGDGGQAWTPQCSHTYREAGTYYVSLRVTDSYGNTGDSVRVIQIRPEAKPSKGPAVVAYLFVAAGGGLLVVLAGRGLWWWTHRARHSGAKRQARKQIAAKAKRQRRARREEDMAESLSDPGEPQRVRAIVYRDPPSRWAVTRLGRSIFRLWVVALVVLAVWALLAYHVILIQDTGTVFLKKTAWTFDNCVIIEKHWALFTFHHPMLASRLLLGDGTWLNVEN